MDMKSKRVRRLDSIRLDATEKTYFTEEGYLVDQPILTSVGIFEYINPDGSTRRELRLPEHVFNEKSLASYKGKPIIITHDAGVVSKNNVGREQIGTIITDGYQSGEDVRAEVIIHDTNAMKNSGLKELSLGYNLDLIEEPGEWNGEPYDGIQTNIVINHLALVSSARAGEQARLNIDGSDEPELKGGKSAMAKKESRKDEGIMSEEELGKAIDAYKARKAERMAGKEALIDEEVEVEEVAPAAEETTETDGDEMLEEIPAEEPTGSTPADIVEIVKDRRDRRDADGDDPDGDNSLGVIAQQDEDIDMLLACIEKLMHESHKHGDSEEAEEANNEDGEETENADEEENEDSSEDQSKSMNADAADKIFRERLSICRIGDKLRIDGLETKSIMEAKKVIIAKVLPTMNMDGRSSAYINASYDLALGEVGKRKDVNYQKKQMTENARRNDGKAQSLSMAQSARERMLDRQEGGNE